MLKDELLVGYALMDLSKPNASVLFSDVDETISANNSRRLAVQKGPVGLGGSNKRQKDMYMNPEMISCLLVTKTSPPSGGVRKRGHVNRS